MTVEELIGKKLKDVIDFLPDNTLLHIGSKNGFLFVGDKTELTERIEGISNDLVDTANTYYQKNKSMMESKIEKLINSKGMIPEFKEQIYKLAKYYKQYKNYESYINNFVPIADRKILDIYPRIQKDGICIIISGSELGKYWDREEYLKGEKGK